MNKWLRCLLFLSFATLPVFNLLAMTTSDQEKEFHQINNVIFGNHPYSIAKKNGVEVILNEIFEGYGGAFRVDSVFKPVGEERYLVTLTGEAANDPNTFYARIILACHELGHIIGGAPFKTGREKDLSAEGQADYAAVSICMKEYYQQSNTKIFISSYSDEQMRACEESYPKEGKDRTVCLTTLSTINSLVEYWNKTLAPEKQLNLFASDPTIVTRTRTGYPSKVCRIQTMRNAALDIERPSCWFNPDDHE